MYSLAAENIPLLSLPTVGVDIIQVPNVGVANDCSILYQPIAAESAFIPLNLSSTIYPNH